MSSLIIQTATQRRVATNPSFAWRKSTAADWRGVVHVFPGIGRSACGKVERDDPRFEYGEDFPRNKSLCQRCNWHATYNYLDEPKPKAKAMLTFATPEAWDDYDPEAERLHGPPSHLTWIYGPVSGELLITEEQLESFERDTHTPLVDDCPSPRVWRRLLRWLLKNIGLFDVTGNRELKLQAVVPTEPDYSI